MILIAKQTYFPGFLLTFSSEQLDLYSVGRSVPEIWTGPSRVNLFLLNCIFFPFVVLLKGSKRPFRYAVYFFPPRVLKQIPVKGFFPKPCNPKSTLTALAGVKSKRWTIEARG